MTPTRRDILKSSAATALGAGLRPLWAADDPPAARQQPLKLLVLGGTGFLGPAIVDAAKARGHTLTLFNRGKTRPELFPDVEKLRGDRDPKKGDGIKSLQGRKWDAVFDDCGHYPRWVKASAELLAPNIRQYVYISSISCYADNSKPGQDESAPLAKMADPTIEEMGKNFEYYGPLKALNEQAAEKAMPGRTTVVRPGYIVGPGDFSDRFTYWPWRVDRARGNAAEVLAPGTPTDPIQVIDVRDLAAWLVRVVEKNVTGVFNACGPAKPATMGEVLDACRAVTGREARFTWVSEQFLKDAPGGSVDLPIWAPPSGETAGFHLWSNARAIKAGLTFRPLKDIIRDTLAWYKTLPADRQKQPRAGLKPEREAELLKAWHERAKK